MRIASFALSLGLVAAPGAAWSIPTDYTLDFAGTSSGTFSVDSDLAAPLGPSGVALIDFSISLNTSVGTLTFGPGDLTEGFIEARFLDGILAGLDSPASTTAEVDTVAGSFGIAIFLSSVAEDAAEIDPANAGEGNFTIVSLPTLIPVDDVCCSYGFAPAEDSHPVPEPTAIVLFALGLLVVCAGCMRATRLG